MAKEFYEIGYRGWYVLETGSPTKDIVADTRANIEYVKKTFRMPPPAGGLSARFRSIFEAS